MALEGACKLVESAQATGVRVSCSQAHRNWAQVVVQVDYCIKKYNMQNLAREKRLFSFGKAEIPELTFCGKFWSLLPFVQI